MHQVMTREPGDLPAFGRSCPSPGDGCGTVLSRLSDERAVGAASACLATLFGVRAREVPTVLDGTPPPVVA